MPLWQLNLDSVNLSDLFLSALILLWGPEARHFQGDVSDKDRETAGIHFDVGIRLSDDPAAAPWLQKAGVTVSVNDALWMIPILLSRNAQYNGARMSKNEWWKLGLCIYVLYRKRYILAIIKGLKDAIQITAILDGFDKVTTVTKVLKDNVSNILNHTFSAIQKVRIHQILKQIFNILKWALLMDFQNYQRKCTNLNVGCCTFGFVYWFCTWTVYDETAFCPELYIHLFIYYWSLQQRQLFPY